MERSLRRWFANGAALGQSAKELFHDWGFPAILLVVWMIATTYTVVLVARGTPPVPGTAAAGGPPRASVVQKTEEHPARS